MGSKILGLWASGQSYKLQDFQPTGLFPDASDSAKPVHGRDLFQVTELASVIFSGENELSLHAVAQQT